MILPTPPKGASQYQRDLHAALTKYFQRLPASSAGTTALFDITDEERSAGVVPTYRQFPELDGRRYNILPANSDNSTGLVQLREVIKAHGGGFGKLPAGQLNYASDLVFDDDSIFFVGAGGDKNITSARGTRLYYTGSGTAIKGESVDSCGLWNMQLRNGGGSGLIGLHILNASNWLCLNLFIREFNNDHFLLECDTTQSTIYNTFINVCGFKADGTAIGVRMVEGATKATNNNHFTNGDFGSNLVGIQQDDECNDNTFETLELGGCVTGAILRGRITLESANIENCTTGVEFITGTSPSIEGSLHFGGNTTDVVNPDDRPIFASMQGGGASNSIGFNPRNTGMGFRGKTPPATGGTNYSVADGDPVIQRDDVDALTFKSQAVAAGLALGLPQMTTTQRNALSPDDGWMIYNTTTAQPEVRKAGAWVAMA